MDVRPIRLADVTLPQSHPRAGSACPVFGFVIAHPAGVVLVDTGVGIGHPWVERHFRPTHHDLDAALAGAGVARDDVAIVINSHLHFDHCGLNSRFPGVPLVAQTTEHGLATAGGYTIDEWFAFEGARWELVEGDADIVPGVRVMATPGHTPGHQSVVVTTGDGPVVIAAQAVYDPDELDAEASVEPLAADEAAATTASARAIKALDPIAVHFSHDARVWRSSPAGILDR